MQNPYEKPKPVRSVFKIVGYVLLGIVVVILLLLLIRWGIAGETANPLETIAQSAAKAPGSALAGEEPISLALDGWTFSVTRASLLSGLLQIDMELRFDSKEHMLKAAKLHPNWDTTSPTPVLNDPEVSWDLRRDHLPIDPAVVFLEGNYQTFAAERSQYPTDQEHPAFLGQIGAETEDIRQLDDGYWLVCLSFSLPLDRTDLSEVTVIPCGTVFVGDDNEAFLVYFPEESITLSFAAPA